MCTYVWTLHLLIHSIKKHFQKAVSPSVWVIPKEKRRTTIPYSPPPPPPLLLICLDMRPCNKDRTQKPLLFLPCRPLPLMIPLYPHRRHRHRARFLGTCTSFPSKEMRENKCFLFRNCLSQVTGGILPCSSSFLDELCQSFFLEQEEEIFAWCFKRWREDERTGEFKRRKKLIIVSIFLAREAAKQLPHRYFPSYSTSKFLIQLRYHPSSFFSHNKTMK